MSHPKFHVSLAGDADEIRAAQRLRYDVFVDELGGDGPLVDHPARLEQDRFDDKADHLILRDMARPASQRVVGAYRLLRGAVVAPNDFYSAAEYDLSLLLETGRPLLELGRSCVHRDYRGGTAMFELWKALAEYVSDHGIEILFGVASFHGTSVTDLAAPLSMLHHRHLAPPELRVTARPPHGAPMNLLPPDSLDRVAAMRAVPPLIKAYLRLGGFVGQGAYVDHAFRTTDVCLIVDTARMGDRRADFDRRGFRE